MDWAYKLQITSNINLLIKCNFFFHKHEEFPDPTSTFLVARALKGVSKDNNTRTRLLPISRSLLHSILDKLVFLFSSPYEYYLYRCLFLLAYYCCLLAGEAVVSTHPQAPQHTLQLLSFSQFSNSSHSTFTIRFSSYKHSREQVTFVLEATSTTNCPVQAFADYTKLRSSVAGPIFLHSPGVPLSRKDFFPAFTSACPCSI